MKRADLFADAGYFDRILAPRMFCECLRPLPDLWRQRCSRVGATCRGRACLCAVTVGRAWLWGQVVPTFLPHHDFRKVPLKIKRVQVRRPRGCTVWVQKFKHTPPPVPACGRAVSAWSDLLLIKVPDNTYEQPRKLKRDEPGGQQEDHCHDGYNFLAQGGYPSCIAHPLPHGSPVRAFSLPLTGINAREDRSHKN
jgi:hypothetical protein